MLRSIDFFFLHLQELCEALKTDNKTFRTYLKVRNGDIVYLNAEIIIHFNKIVPKLYLWLKKIRTVNYKTTVLCLLLIGHKRMW